jgi:hypothetical protein
MAHPVKQLQLSEYQDIYSFRFENIKLSTLYYAPNITDATTYWVLNAYDAANPEGSALIVFENVINAGYSVIVYCEDLTPDTEIYKYRLRVTDNDNAIVYDQIIDASDYSVNELIFKFVVYAAGSPPAAPSGLTAFALGSAAISLTWTDNSIDEINFKIELSPDNSTWVQIATVGYNITTYTSIGLSPVTTYYYRVRASNAYGDSSYSNVAFTTTPFGSFGGG